MIKSNTPYAGDRNRTGTVLPQQDFKSCASASSATPAKWAEKDSNLRRRCQQIYSLPPLATRESAHKADERTRTVNLLITNQLLCQLSHIGVFFFSTIHNCMSGTYRARTCDPLLVRQMLSQLS